MTGRSSSGKNERRATTSNSQSVIAVASAVRSLPSSSAISPKISPSLIMLRMSSFPSEDGALITTRPRSTAIMLLPGSPLQTI